MVNATEFSIDKFYFPLQETPHLWRQTLTSNDVIHNKFKKRLQTILIRRKFMNENISHLGTTFSFRGIVQLNRTLSYV